MPSSPGHLHEGLDTSDSVAVQSGHWRALIILLVLYALSLLDRQILNLLVDPIKRDIGASDIQISVLQGFAFAAFYCTCGVPLGYLADRVNRRRLIFWGVAVWSVATASCGLARTYEQLLVARLLVGAGEAALLPAAYSLISNLFPRDRVTTALGIFSTGAMIGAGLSSAIGGGVIGIASKMDIGAAIGLPASQPWQVVFLLTGAAGLPLALLVFLISEPPRPGIAAGPARARLGQFMRTRKAFFSFHLIGFASLTLASYAGGAWMPTYLSRRFGLDIPVIGSSIGAVVSVFGILGMVFGARWVDRSLATGRADAHFRFYVFGGAATAVLGAAAPFCTTPAATIALFGATNLFVSIAGVASASLQLATPAELRGRVSALYLMAVNLIAMGFGPLAVSLSARFVFGNSDRIGPALAFVYAVSGTCGAAAFLLGLPAARVAIGSGTEHRGGIDPKSSVDGR